MEEIILKQNEIITQLIRERQKQKELIEILKIEIERLKKKNSYENI